MLKKIIFLCLIFALVTASSVSAKQEQKQNTVQIQEAQTEDSEEVIVSDDEENNEDKNDEAEDWVQNQINQGAIGIQMQNQVRARNVNELKKMIQNKKQEMQQIMVENKERVRQQVQNNQNVVREAVHALLASEDLLGNVGQRVSAIAQEFNNSVDKTIQAEEKIRLRGWFKRLISGGDAETGQELLAVIQENDGKLQQLKQYQENCNCGEELGEILQEQIQNMESEQTRLREMAESEVKWKGIWSWIKSLF